MANGARVNRFYYDPDFNVAAVKTKTKGLGRTAALIELQCMIQDEIPEGEVIEMNVVLGFSFLTGGLPTHWVRKARIFDHDAPFVDPDGSLTQDDLRAKWRVFSPQTGMKTTSPHYGTAVGSGGIWMLAHFWFHGFPTAQGTFTYTIERRNDASQSHGTPSPLDLYVQRTSLIPVEA